TLLLYDDWFSQVTLSGSNTVALYRLRTNVFFVGSNGYITFGNGDATVADSFQAHFNLPRISGLARDYNPEAGGTISWKQLSNRVAVTFSEVPQYGMADTNSFQIELFFNGVIRLTYLELDTPSGLAGLSEGLGIPLGFAASDLSNYPQCLSNNLPALSAI